MSDLYANIYLLPGTSAALSAENATHDAGRPVYETDTHRLKIHDGVTAYNALPYIGSNTNPQIVSHDVFVLGAFDAVPWLSRKHMYRALVTGETAFRLKSGLEGIRGECWSQPDTDFTISVICSRANNEIAVADIDWKAFDSAPGVIVYEPDFEFRSGDVLVLLPNAIPGDLDDVSVKVWGERIASPLMPFTDEFKTKLLRAWVWDLAETSDEGESFTAFVPSLPATIKLRNSYNGGSALDASFVTATTADVLECVLNQRVFTKDSEETKVWEVGDTAQPGATYVYASDTRVGGVGAGLVIAGTVKIFRKPDGTWKLDGVIHQDRYDANEDSVRTTVRWQVLSYFQLCADDPAYALASNNGYAKDRKRIESEDFPGVAINIEFGDATYATTKRWSGGRLEMEMSWNNAANL